MTAPSLGSYVLDERIAVGGTSEVFRAFAVGDARTPNNCVVVKRLLPHLRSDSAFRALYAREAQLQSRVCHPNVVRVLAAPTIEDGEPILVSEYVDGVDCDRFIRWLRQHGQQAAPAFSVHIACELLSALAAVHAATGADGARLNIVHRDVSPSNVYFARNGDVKLGDFGLAKSQLRGTQASESGTTLKGKFAYLSPEQVAGDVADHRADLFSLAVLLAELMLGRPLFSGASQIAVLLAIRDGMTERIGDLAGFVAPGLLAVLERALARRASERFADADAFAVALRPFRGDRVAEQRRLAAHVTTLLDARERISATATPVQSPDGRGAAHLAPANGQPEPDATPGAADPGAAPDGRPSAPSFARTSSGELLGPLSFAELVEAIAVGKIVRGDRVHYMGLPEAAVEDTPDLERFLTPTSSVTIEMAGIGAPDFQDEVRPELTLDLLARIMRGRESGVLFAAQTEQLPAGTAARSSGPHVGRKELYFEAGRLLHVSSSDGSELLGASLLRRGLLERDELAVALAVLPRYGGHMGETLIALGLVGPVDVFRAIQEQGRDRVADLFRWSSGRLAFYRGAARPHIDFPLKLDLPALLLAGLEAQAPETSLVTASAAILDKPLLPERGSLDDGFEWPLAVVQTHAAAAHCATLRDLLRYAAETGAPRHDDVIRAFYVLIAAKKLQYT